MKAEEPGRAKACCVPSAEHAATALHPTYVLPATPGVLNRKSEWVVIPDSRFRMGTDSPEGFPEDGEGPSREVAVSSFRIAATAVTNAQFREFVKATGYITEAEQVGASFVFYLQVEQALRDSIRQVPSGLPWWLSIEGACWQRPTGPGSNIYDRLDHPVVQVSWNDSIAYCQWRNCRLPSEAQWEWAAREGVSRTVVTLGVMRCIPKARCSARSGKVNSRTCRPRDGRREPLRWIGSHRMASACSTRPAMSGNGVRIGSVPTTIALRRRKIQSSINQPAGVQCVAVRSCVTTLTAIVIGLQLARRTRLRVRRAISGSGSQPTADQSRCSSGPANAGCPPAVGRSTPSVANQIML